MGFFWAAPGLNVTFEQILQHIQAQYPGQLVLYAADLAKVLGKTEKALTHLIARDQLPFELKSLGGRKCVDIFQVASWLTSGVEEAAASGPELRGRRSADAARAVTPRPPKQRAGSIGARLMELRHEAARNMRRLAAECRDIEDAGFFNEFSEGLLSQACVSGGRWTVIYTRWKSGAAVLVREDVKVFAKEYDDVLPAVAGFEADTGGATRATLVAKRGRLPMYRAFFLEDFGWTVVLNAL